MVDIVTTTALRGSLPDADDNRDWVMVAEEEEDGARLFVRRVPEAATEVDLMTDFLRFGRITKCVLHGQGFAFVQFVHKADATDAYHAMNNSFYHGEKLLVAMAASPSPTTTVQYPILFENVAPETQQRTFADLLGALRIEFDALNVYDSKTLGRVCRAFCLRPDAARAAVARLDGTVLDGNALRCTIEEPALRYAGKATDVPAAPEDDIDRRAEQSRVHDTR